MYRQHSITGFAALAGIFVTGLAMHPAIAQTNQQPDNTRVNKQDREPGAVTADQQKENRSDRDLTQQIRKALIADLSRRLINNQITLASINRTESRAQSRRISRKKPAATAI